jgi:putative PIN family toxin of toxin-antitoxin system
MKVSRAVIDTNVLISAALSSTSAPALVTRHLLAHGLVLFSQATFAELESRLWRPKFDRYLSMDIRHALLHDWAAVAHWVVVNDDSARYSRDADDVKFIHAALAGAADWLITGDKDLLALRRVQDVHILSPADAWAISRAS